MGFIEFTKLSFALFSVMQPFDQMGNIPEHVFVILSQRKSYAGRFQKETAGKRTGLMTKWPPRWLLFTCLRVTGPNATEAERPFYRRSRMVLHVRRRLPLQLLASVLSSRVRFQILDSSYHFN